MSTPVEVKTHEFKAWRGQPSAMSVSHIHSDIELNFVTSGQVEYFLAGHFEVLAPGSLHIFWAGIPHSLIGSTEDAEMLWVVVPLAWFLQWELPVPFVDSLLAGRVWSDLQPSRLQHDLMLRWCQDFEALPFEASPFKASQKSNSGYDQRKSVALEVEAFLRRIAPAQDKLDKKVTRKRPTNPSAGHATVSPATSIQAEKLAAFVSQNYRADITIQEIAHAVQLHPNYAMQLFRTQCGLSLWEYVLRLRVSHAQYLLLTTNRKLSDIARDSGFSSDSRFYAAFEKYSGCTPRAWHEKSVRRYPVV